ncbi:chaperonin 10-like protein [Crucibulum laeve]|uniref:Chaperonin 10-like protein n=1 Tax=Crucibulum laeve TaxID=68775 RepID=A0A5C3LZV0_9AGAR|nr:chaperonin 10-like protein [Crucibulum laeve]
MSMKALVTAPGNTAVVGDMPIPEPGPHEIRVEVRSIALNPVDALYVAHPSDGPGRIVGSDIAGIVNSVGEGVQGWKIGDRVAGLLQGATSGNPRPGGFAKYAILEADLTIGIPSSVSFEEAATLPLCSLTAAQALFIRLRLPAPFPSPFTFPVPTEPPAVLIYSASTSLGLFTVQLASLLRTASGDPYRIYVTASPRHIPLLTSLGVPASHIFDYRSPTWVEDVKKASGGITHAVDCISEDDSTGRVSETFVEAGGNLAVIRNATWDKDKVRPNVEALYGAVWSGLGYELQYNNRILPASPTWRAFSVAFFAWLSAGAPDDATRFPIAANPVRLMPGGLERVATDGFELLGAGNVVSRARVDEKEEEREWMRPISGEKLVYRIGDV